MLKVAGSQIAKEACVGKGQCILVVPTFTESPNNKVFME